MTTTTRELIELALDAYDHAIKNGHREKDALAAFDSISIPALARAALALPAQPHPTDDLPEPELGYIDTDKSRQPAFSARQMREFREAQPQGAGEAVAGVVLMRDGSGPALVKRGQEHKHDGYRLYTAPQQAGGDVVAWGLDDIEQACVMADVSPAQFAPEGQPLIAAMRCYVTSKLGEEVEVPKELL